MKEKQMDSASLTAKLKMCRGFLVAWLKNLSWRRDIYV